MNRNNENRVQVDEYSKNIVLSNTFDFNSLKTSWFAQFSNQNVQIYSLAYSFAYFLEEKYKALFLPTAKVSEDNWVEYVENHFKSSVDKLIEEWKKKLKSNLT